MIWLFALLIGLMAPGAVEATQRYAAPGGLTTGNCLTTGTACTVARMLAVIACGDTGTLLNGTYTGSAGMLRVTSGTTSAPTCTLGNEVTINTEGEGTSIGTNSVLIDAEGSSLTPLWPTGITYWNFEGMYFARGNGVIFIDGSHHINVRRVVAWDAPLDANLQVLFVGNNSSNVLFEDIGAFGLGEETCMDGGSTPNLGGIVWRRVFCRAEGTPRVSSAGLGSATVQFNYTSENDPNPGLFENVILTSGAARKPVGYITNTMRHSSSGTVRIYGTIHYPGNSSQINSFLAIDGSLPTQCVGYVMQDSVFHTNGTSYRPIANDGSGGKCDTGASGSAQYTRVTSIRGSGAASTLGTFGTSTNFIESVTVGGTGFDYVGTGNTAKLCFRYVDGTYTSTPLWPWPMDDRIKAAIAANSGSGSTALSGTAGSGYAANTVTSEIVSMLGSIPTACMTGASFTPSFPVASDFPSVSVRDDFDRSDSGTLGTGWTNLTVDTFSIVSNAAAAPAVFSRALYSDTKMQNDHEVYATWNTIASPGSSATFLTFAAQDLTLNNQYRVLVTQTSGSNTTVEVWRVDGVGGQTQIMSAVDLGIEAVAGNSFGVRVSGTTISVYWKWTDGIWYRIGQFTDANLPTSGGVYGGIAGVSPSVINNYGAGPFVDQPVQNPPTPPASTGVGRFGTTFPGVR